MAKRWQEFCNVDVKSFHLELLAIDFLKGWSHSTKTALFHDWMIRDYFAYLLEKEARYFFVPGTTEFLTIRNSGWVTKARMAFSRSKKAIEYDVKELPCLAGEEWQKIFGSFIPKC
ncbi:MAG: hypothetical protein ED559_07830 [Phycisphaera sp.]|nr:MAG: hypothetical protein ED559_07830 [Phycisphaera sp.]